VLTFKALHILAMVAMVTIEIGAESLYALAISRRDVGALATVHRLLDRARAGPASIVAFVSGVVFGLLTAATGGMDFLDGWLIAAYVLVVLFLASTSMFLREALKLGRAAVDVGPSDGSTDQVMRQLSHTRVMWWFAIDVAIVVAFILDMVLKPF
jgi:hypothetical protein